MRIGILIFGAAITAIGNAPLTGFAQAVDLTSHLKPGQRWSVVADSAIVIQTTDGPMGAARTPGLVENVLRYTATVGDAQDGKWTKLNLAFDQCELKNQQAGSGELQNVHDPLSLATINMTRSPDIGLGGGEQVQIDAGNNNIPVESEEELRQLFAQRWLPDQPLSVGQSWSTQNIEPLVGPGPQGQLTLQVVRIESTQDGRQRAVLSISGSAHQAVGASGRDKYEEKVDINISYRFRGGAYVDLASGIVEAISLRGPAEIDQGANFGQAIREHGEFRDELRTTFLPPGQPDQSPQPINPGPSLSENPTNPPGPTAPANPTQTTPAPPAATPPVPVPPAPTPLGVNLNADDSDNPLGPPASAPPAAPGNTAAAPAGANPLGAAAAPAPSPAAPLGFQGQFVGDPLSVSFAPSQDNGYSGTIIDAATSAKYPFQASGSAAQISGTFSTDGQQFEMTMSLSQDGQTLTMSTGGKTYTMKQSSPAQPTAAPSAAEVNPLGTAAAAQTPATPPPPSAAQFEGQFDGNELSLRFDENSKGPDHYFGVIALPNSNDPLSMNGQFKFSASGTGSVIQGSFTDGTNTFPITLTLSDDGKTLTMTTGSKTFTMKK